MVDAMARWGRYAWFVLLLCYLLVLGFLSLNPWLRPTSTPDVFSPDKLDHALAYGGLVIIIYFTLIVSVHKLGNCGPCAWTAALASSIAIGVLIEIAQSLFTVNRAGSVVDAVANAAGAVLGFAAFQLGRRFIAKR